MPAPPESSPSISHAVSRGLCQTCPGWLPSFGCRGRCCCGIGSAAAKEMIGLLKSGRSVGITPDGPKGPARTIKPGVLTLAQLSGCPILPLTNAVSRKLTLEKSWDKFQVPLPFSNIVIGYAKPIYVMPDDDPEEISAQLRASLDAITHQADRMIDS